MKVLPEIKGYLQAQHMDVVGVAPAAEWPSEQPECRSAEILKGCRRVIVFGKEIPYPIYRAEKHAAVLAGLGTMGKNSPLVNKQFGNRLRLGGVLTTAELPAGKPLKKSMCAVGCRKCIEVCPMQALDGNGGIDQYKCLKNCIVHPILSLGFFSKWFKHSRFVNKTTEMTTKTLISAYTYSCNSCLVNCPNFRRGIPKTAKSKSS